MSSLSENVWLGLFFPLAFGAIAAFCYWKTLSSQLEPVYLTQVNVVKQRGEPLSAADLVPVAIQGDAPRLAHGVLAWSEKGIAIGQSANRKLLKGQLLLKTDLDLGEESAPLRPGERECQLHLSPKIIVAELEVGAELDFKMLAEDGSLFVLGPYRLLRLNRTSQPGTSDDREIESITIAFEPYEDGSRPEDLDRIDAALVRESHSDHRDTPHEELVAVLKH